VPGFILAALVSPFFANVHNLELRCGPADFPHSLAGNDPLISSQRNHIARRTHRGRSGRSWVAPFRRAQLVGGTLAQEGLDKRLRSHSKHIFSRATGPASANVPR